MTTRRTLTIIMTPDWRSALRRGAKSAQADSYQGETLNFEMLQVVCCVRLPTCTSTCMSIMRASRHELSPGWAAARRQASLRLCWHSAMNEQPSRLGEGQHAVVDRSPSNQN